MHGSDLATFMPWSASLKRFSRLQDVGPMVHTILVFLNGVAALEISGLQHENAGPFSTSAKTCSRRFAMHWSCMEKWLTAQERNALQAGSPC